MFLDVTCHSLSCCVVAQIEAMDAHGPVLVVDDDPAILDAMRRLFELSGHAVVTAQDGEEAMGFLRGGLVPCLILLDLDMPVKDGLSFRREQLADPALVHIPVIIYSSRPDAAEIARRLQAVAHFPKSMDFEALLPLVANHCSRPVR